MAGGAERYRRNSNFVFFCGGIGMSAALVRSFLLAVVVLGASISGGMTAKAQGLPPGSYQRSCQQLHWAGTTLVGECRREDGGFSGTGLAGANTCRGDIANINGQLRCVSGGPPPAQGYAPPPPNYGAGPGYAGPGYGGRDEARERCEDLWRRRNELRDRVQYTFGPERERLEYRLHEIHEERERLGCHWE